MLAFAPLLLPPVFQVAVWERLAEPGGLLCTLLPFAVESDKPFPIRNFTSAVILLGLNYSPSTFFFLSHALRAIPNELLTAARLHSGSWLSYWRVQLPLAMPSFLAGCSWDLAPGDCHADLGLPCSTDFGEEKCAAGMAYQGVRSIPKDWDDWRHMVQGAVGMAVKTFGISEVQKWRFVSAAKRP